MKQKLLRQTISVLWVVVMLIVTLSKPTVLANNESIINLSTITGLVTDSREIATPKLDVNAIYTNTYYVDNTNPSALDSNPGTDPDFPLLTITRGAELAGPGDLVYVLHGAYSETVYLPDYGGVDGSPITFSANPDVVISGSGSNTFGAAFYLLRSTYVTIEGFHIVGTAYKGIFVTQSDNIEILNNIVTGSGQRNNDLQQPGIHFQTVVNSTIDGNFSYDNSYDGIKLTVNSNNNIIRNNTVYGNYSQPLIGDYTDATGIMVNNSDANLVIHNFVYDNEDSGINFFNNSNNNMVVENVSYGNRDHGIDNNSSSGQIITGNTVHGNFTSGINLELNSGSASVMNNVVMDNGLNPTVGHKPGNIYVDNTSSAGTILNYNLYYRSGGTVQLAWDGTQYATLASFKITVPTQEVNGLESNPLFVFPAPVATETTGSTGGDYHILSGSLAIDSANSNATAQPLTDIEGNPRFDDLNVTDTGFGVRTYDDRGAYEYQGIDLYLTNLDLLQSINQTDWKDVPGSYADGFEMVLNPVVDYYYLDTTNLVSNQPLADGMYEFFFSSYPVGFFDYWAALGVDGTEPYAEPWMPVMWEIINGNQPVFYLQVTGTDYELVDGLQYIVSGGSLVEPLRINGTYLLGAYTFSGHVEDNLANTDDVIVDITFIEPIELTVSGISANNKVYDGNTTADLNTGLAELVGVVGGDDVHLDDSGAVGTFADANVGDGITVTVSGLALTGTDVLNYALTQPVTSADITEKELTVTGITANNKTYDGNTSAALNTGSANLVGVIGDDDVNLYVSAAVGTFADPNVADGITVTVSGLTLFGTESSNYTLIQPTTTANISAKHITGSFTAANKVYDGTTDATVLTRSLNGVIGDDDVQLVGGTATFEDPDIGDNKTVTLTGAALDGTDKDNYILDSVDTTTASILSIMYKLYLPLIMK